MLEDEDDDDGGPLFSFKSAAQLRSDALTALTRRHVSSLSPREVFELIDAGLTLEKCIPRALQILASGQSPDLGAAQLKSDVEILEGQGAYFCSRPQEAGLLQRIKQSREKFEGAGALRRRECPHCQGANGKPKDVYHSQDYAQEVARQRRAKVGIALMPYPCPRGNGWHLTKTG